MNNIFLKSFLITLFSIVYLSNCSTAAKKKTGIPEYKLRKNKTEKSDHTNRDKAIGADIFQKNNKKDTAIGADIRDDAFTKSSVIGTYLYYTENLT